MINKEDFCEKIRLCERAMYSLAYSILRNDADAAEAISEAICRAYKNINTLKNENAFKAWILRVVHNVAVEMIRDNSRLISIEDAPEIAEEGSENKIATKIALREAVNNLKQPYRTVVVLFYYENLSVSKISEITSTSAVTVKKQLSRARRMLKEALREDFNI